LSDVLTKKLSRHSPTKRVRILSHHRAQGVFELSLSVPTSTWLTSALAFRADIDRVFDGDDPFSARAVESCR